MQKSLAQLLEILVNGNIFTVCPSKNGKIKLKEPNISEHEIFDLPSDAFAVQCPNNQHWAFGQTQYGKICDYLIFIPQKGALTVVFCELKRSVGERSKVRAARQIVATIPLLQYLLSAVNTHFGKKWRTVNERYAIFGARLAIEKLETNTESEKENSEKTAKPRTKEEPRYFYEHPKNERNVGDKIKIGLVLGGKRIPINAIT